MLRHQPENINIKHRDSLKKQDKVAVFITHSMGTMYAVYIICLAVSFWMLWQLISENPIDPFPFAFMVFLTNIFQLVLMPLIMVGQNIQNKHAEMRAEEEYKTTKTILEDLEILLKRQS